ncbi:pirin family protein [Chelatococcus sp. XZ-Ab1]|uniref:pirin family protein n=1 Tax=Chelatococcus sp. XZ-Ab1 TaxID=3034027 RepID=UPI0023E456C9|nr:pirin family protein [Chelatococcus sp. XZ-Ab1]
MSWLRGKDPVAGDAPSCDAVDLVIVPRVSDIGGFAVRRALPTVRRRMVGPFIFWDEMGPADFAVGDGLDVWPHPHIGLATLTYLFEGAIVHRDSLGSEAIIRPGAVNLMSAGRGIVHSERTGLEERVRGGRLAGIQSWVALPAEREEDTPAFSHYDENALPDIVGEGKHVRIVAGTLFGATSPVATASEAVYADVALAAGASIPFDPVAEERAIYTVSGAIDIAGDRFEAHRLLVFKPGDAITITALTPARFLMLGGAPMDGKRYIWWNFVSSRKERIEEAKEDWKLGRFAGVPGDDEFIPLPEM